MAYSIPTDLHDALVALAAGARPIAGGTDLYASLGEGLPKGDLVDLTRIGGLGGIGHTGNGWRIGATATWSQIARADLPPAFAALQQAAREVGALQVQNAGTIGGNLVNASPAADGVVPLLLLDAEVEVTSLGATRHLPLSEFLVGPRQTALRQGEVLRAIHLPAPPAGRSAFAKLGSRAYLVISFVMVAALLELDRGVIRTARIAVGACSPVARRLSALEEALTGQDVALLGESLQITATHLAPLAPIDDLRADAAYRLDAARVLVRRALLQAAGMANG